MILHPRLELRHAPGQHYSRPPAPATTNSDAGTYAVSKWGLIRLTLTLAKEVGPYNIQVNAVCPGPVAGERMRRVIADLAAERGRPAEDVGRDYVEATVLKRLVRAEHVTALVTFLASPSSDSITGQAIEVSAGYGL